ncbi:hypothetical protein GOL45_29295 [Sinorhizobium medicae]|nr:hypothetical protein [Sinorhizobium medicae]MDX0858503.1 hypothetical protein [Sinorhizobium medicae]MDX0999063.1 hypothetical protein [Sinorhizobium medicae]MDX1066272.1 hypothetical protein [Sinorhizobium medicae]MDX1182150.1 hypothetical protein [Sinorhizobium medicae]
MRFAFILSLAAIGVSFLLPSDGYKAALFLICAGLAYLFMKEYDERKFVGYPEVALGGPSESAEKIWPETTDEELDTYRMNDSDRDH